MFCRVHKLQNSVYPHTVSQKSMSKKQTVESGAINIMTKKGGFFDAMLPYRNFKEANNRIYNTGWGKSPVTKFYVNFSTNKFN